MTLLQERFRLNRDFARDLTADITTAGALNNVSVTTISAVRFTLATSISGFAGNGLSQIVSVINANTAALQVLNESANSTAANRISTGTGSDVTIPAGGLFEIFYDTVATRWRLLSGGGGTQLNEQPLKNYLLTYANAAIAPGTLALIATTGNIATTAGLFHADSTSGAAALTSSASTALRGAFNYFTAVSGAALAGTTFVQFPAFALEAPDLGKAIPINFDINSTLTDGDWDIVVVRYNSSGVHQEILSVAGNASTASATPSAKLPGGTSQFNGFFVSGSTLGDLYALRLRRLVGSVQVRTDTLFTGPQPVRIGATTTDLQSYTPTISNLGTGSGTATGFFRRNGDTAEIAIRFIKDASGGSGGAGVTFSLPLGLAIDATKTQSTSGMRVLQGVALSSTGTGYVAGLGNTSGASDVRFLNLSAGEAIGSVFVANSSWDMKFTVPITGWSSNIVTGDRAVESFAADDGTSDVFGPNGALVPNVGFSTGITSRQFTFQNVNQATDAVVVELKIGSSSGWQNAADVFPFAYGHNNLASNAVGIQGTWQSATTFQVNFGNRGDQVNVSGNDNGRNAWSAFFSSGARFRVRMVSGGAQVGFPISARNVVGDTSGTVVPSGYVGETVSAFNSPTAYTSSSTINVHALTIQPGKWRLDFQAGAGGTTVNGFDIWLATASASSTGRSEGENWARMYNNGTSGTTILTTGISGLIIDTQSAINRWIVLSASGTGSMTYTSRFTLTRIA